MLCFIWFKKILKSDGTIRLGGVETYIIQLNKIIKKIGFNPVVLTVGLPEKSNVIDGVNIECLSNDHWNSGIIPDKYMGQSCINLIATTQAIPKNLKLNIIAIQHGVPWDRPSDKLFTRSKILNKIFAFIRLWRGLSCINKVNHLVCVDLVFPTLAACIFQPFSWKNIHYIPNSAPKHNNIGTFDSKITKIVFQRRLERHRGTLLFCEAIEKILVNHKDIEVHIIGEGQDEILMKDRMKIFNNVKFYSLEYKNRLDSLDTSTLSVIPSLSSEGTSLSCIEAWSRGAAVISTGVGGLSNLVIDGHNGIVIRPLVDDLIIAIENILANNNFANALKVNGYNTFLSSFSEEIWSQRWKKLLLGLKEENCHEK